MAGIHHNDNSRVRGILVLSFMKRSPDHQNFNRMNSCMQRSKMLHMELNLWISR